LVRDGGIEDYDAPPAEPPKAELVEVRPTQPSDGSDLHRADDRSAGAVYDPKAARDQSFFYAAALPRPEDLVDGERP
jgi:hypothetical protein